MDIFVSASVIAAFIAGMAALFAPCCITVLLPTYLASVFHQRKKVLSMTFIFFLGIATILVPVGLGVAALAQTIAQFHNQLNIIGGAFMILLGLPALWGRTLFKIPMPIASPRLDVKRPLSVFAIGMFSGAATSCCAPVMAGVMTLAVLSGSFWNAVIVSTAYVFGMTFPLFAIAYTVDRWGKRIPTTIGKFPLQRLSGAIFIIMGAILFTLGFQRNALWSPAAQAELGVQLQQWSNSAVATLSAIPNGIWATVLIGLFLFFLVQARKK